MYARDAIVVLTNTGMTLGMSKDEIIERLSGGERSEEIHDFGHDRDGIWTIVRTRHRKDEAAEKAARECS